MTMTLSTALARNPCPVPRPSDFLMVAGVVILLAAALAACGGGSDSASEASDGGSSSMGAAPPGEGTEPATETQDAAPPPSQAGPPSAPAPVAVAGLIGLDASTSCGMPGFQADLLQQINNARAIARQCGANAMPAAAPLSWNARLFSAAARHSRDMARNDYFSHTSLDGRSMGERVNNEGYAWTAVAENIAAGQGSVSAVMATWLSSPGHCANIMRANHAHVAVSCVHQTGSRYGRYWTMVLAKP